MKTECYATIEPVRYGRDAICTIISDDGRPSTVEEWFKITSKYNMKVTVAQVVENIIDLQRLQKIEESNHIEFISHSYSHLKMDKEDIPDHVLRHEIFEAKKFMEKNFITSQIAFVPPNNQLSDKAYDICDECFYAVRRWCRELNLLSPGSGRNPLDWMNLGCKGIGDVHTSHERNQWVDECVKKKRWLIEMWHDINENPFFEYQTISPADAEEHIQYICRKEGLWVASFVDAVKYIYERQTSEVNVYKLALDRWQICLEKGIAQIDGRFDIPLSVRINLQRRFLKGGINLIRESGTKEYVVLQEAEGEYSELYLEMMPGENVTICIAE